LPYGKWTCADGREVLFNRFYELIFQRNPGEQPSPADPHEWVRWTQQEWFYDDATPDRRKTTLGEAILETWGLPIPSKRSADAYRERERRPKIYYR
jgi:hypothetical protein